MSTVRKFEAIFYSWIFVTAVSASAWEVFGAPLGRSFLLDTFGTAMELSLTPSISFLAIHSFVFVLFYVHLAYFVGHAASNADGTNAFESESLLITTMIVLPTKGILLRSISFRMRGLSGTVKLRVRSELFSLLRSAKSPFHQIVLLFNFCLKLPDRKLSDNDSVSVTKNPKHKEAD